MKFSLARLARRMHDPTIIHIGLGKYTTDYSNLPERYLKRKITKIKYKSPIGPEYTPKMKSFKIQYHGLDRPWVQQYWTKNPAFKYQETAIVEPILEENWMWFRGDRVEILTGPDKGKQGYINMIVQERNWVTVEGLNVEYETIGASKDFPGMMIKKELPLIVTTDIKLVDPSSEQGADVEWRYSEAGERVRVAVKSGTDIPVPTKSLETLDYKMPAEYKANEFKDTAPKVVEEITYEPTLGTFEMDVMQAMGIKESRIPRKTW